MKKLITLTISCSLWFTTTLATHNPEHLLLVKNDTECFMIDLGGVMDNELNELLLRLPPGSQKLSATDLYNTYTLAKSATENNISNRLVKRNTNGDFSIHTLTCTTMTMGSSEARGTLTLTGTGSVIYLGSSPFIHAQGDTSNTNFFAGANAGAANLDTETLSGISNVGVGASALNALTSGNENVAVGRAALASNTTGAQNTALGYYALKNTLDGAGNTAVGCAVLTANTSGVYNIGMGVNALTASTTATNNVAIGAQSSKNCRLGSNNTALGNESLINLTLGNNNIAVGMQAGNHLTTGSNNMYIGHGGASTEAQTIRLGNTSTHTSCYIAGIASTAVPSGTLVGVTADGQLGTITTPDFSGTENNIGSRIVKRNSSGDFSTHTITCTNITMGSSQTRGTLTLTGTGSVVYIGSGIGAQPFMHAQGNTANNNLFIGTQACATNLDSATLSGANNLGVGTNTLNKLSSGNFNTALGSNALATNASGHNNTAVGYSTLKSTLNVNNNTGVGYSVLTANTTGTGNVAMGINALTASTTATNNVAIGSQSCLSCRKGSNNTALGNESLINLTNGNNNIALGIQAGDHLITGNQNIYIGNRGASTEAQTIRLGTTSTHTSCYIAGIYTNSLSSGSYVGVATNGQLGTLSAPDVIGSSNNLANYLVLRDANGDFSTHTVTCTNVNLGSSGARGTLTLTGTGSAVYLAGQPFIHAQGDINNTNFFAGVNAAATNINTDTLACSGNVGAGNSALNALAGGNYNTAIGRYALATNANGNNNTAIGYSALKNTLNVNDNTGVGYLVLTANTTGTGNVGLGVNALTASTTATNNVAIGAQSCLACRLGSNNTALGNESLKNLTLGNNNIALGMQAGNHLTTGNSNIYIGNGGASTEGQTIRLGTTSTHTSCAIAGIYGATSASSSVVLINSAGQLGTITSSRKFKTAITDLTPNLIDRVLKLRPVSFTYNPEIDSTKTPQFGLIAEEVKELIPELVVPDQHGAPYTVRYHFLSPLLLATVQHQEKQLQELEASLKKLCPRS